MKVGITGHQQLPHEADWTWVRGTLVQILTARRQGLVGLSSLAQGADQEFADVVIQLHGELWAVIPFVDYETRFRSAHSMNRYLSLLGNASQIEVLESEGGDEERYLAAGQRIVETADAMVAVWDGEPARGRGGTADVVHHAASIGRRVVHVNPITREVHGELRGSAQRD